MARYRLNMGKHRDGGITYTRGQIITTDKDLSKLNPIAGVPKFELLADENTTPEQLAVAAARGGGSVEGGDARTARDVGHTAAAPGGQVSSGFQVASGPTQEEPPRAVSAPPPPAPVPAGEENKGDRNTGNRNKPKP